MTYLNKNITYVIALLLLLSSCNKPLEWPSSPLYFFEHENEVGLKKTREEVIQEIVGHYAHYDVVSYEDKTTKTPMRTFIISYGFTDFFMEDGKLMMSNRFLFANQVMSRKNATSGISDEAVQAIKPVPQEVDLSFSGGQWHIYRPPTPTLLGITGDPALPLSKDPVDASLTDPDNDGNPGVTVHISVGKFFEGEIYITRREIFSYYLKMNADGTITGHVEDKSEQFVIGASKKILAQPSNSVQHEDMGMSPVLLVPVDPEIDTAEELMEIRDEIFPEEPGFES
ncbi:MAG TPA: hypothetical protein VJ951_15490 [Bacteroidales bacterium]|nr:hypothetical protein [Bacteroidales bacterium]